MSLAAELVRDATKGTDWEGKLFLVGGIVRDPLFGLEEPKDIDIVVLGSAIKLANELFAKGISEIKPVTYPRFGTSLIRIKGSNVELASARKESYKKTSRKPHVKPASLEEDALRRDFTINSLMRDLFTEELLDLTKRGLQDIKDKVLRTPLDPKITFRDDPLRMLRAVRFKNRLGLRYEANLHSAIVRERERLNIISNERIRDELVKMLLHPSAPESLKDLMDLGLFGMFAPEFVEGVGVEQGNYHAKDVWGHTLDVVREASSLEIDESKKYFVVLGALFHDIAKPRTKSVEPDGRVRFFGHERVGADMTKNIMKRLRFSSSDISKVSSLVQNHMRLGSANPLTTSAARRLVRDMSELTEILILLTECDSRAIGRIPKEIDFEEVRERVSKVKTVGGKRVLASPLDGEEIMNLLKIPAGPEVGRWKKRLEEAVIEEEIAIGDKEGAKKLLKREYKNKASSKEIIHE